MLCPPPPPKPVPAGTPRRRAGLGVGAELWGLHPWGPLLLPPSFSPSSASSSPGREQDEALHGAPAPDVQAGSAKITSSAATRPASPPLPHPHSLLPSQNTAPNSIYPSLEGAEAAGAAETAESLLRDADQEPDHPVRGHRRRPLVHLRLRRPLAAGEGRALRAVALLHRQQRQRPEVQHRPGAGQRGGAERGRDSHQEHGVLRRRGRDLRPGAADGLPGVRRRQLEAQVVDGLGPHPWLVSAVSRWGSELLHPHEGSPHLHGLHADVLVRVHRGLSLLPQRDQRTAYQQHNAPQEQGRKNLGAEGVLCLCVISFAN